MFKVNPNEDDEFLDKHYIGKSRATSSAYEWRLGDVVLTAVVILFGLQDLIMGSIFTVSPDWALGNMYSYEAADIAAAPLAVTLLEQRGAAMFETGTACLLIAIYRGMRWFQGMPFNGVIFQTTFLVNTIGRSILLGIDSSQNMDVGWYMVVGRLALSGLSLLISLWSFGIPGFRSRD